MYSVINSRNIYKLIFGLIISSFVVIAYYWSTNLSEYFIHEYRKIMSTILSAIGYLGGIFMYKHSKNDRSKKVFSIILIMLANASLMVLANLYHNKININNEIISPFIILYGGTFAFLMSVYPIELLRPNWLDYKKIFLCYSPTLLLVVIFYILKHYYGDIKRFNDMQECIDGLYSAKSIVRIGICLYPAILLYFMNHLKKEYLKWCENNYAITDDIDITWLDNYLFYYLIILISYVVQINFYIPSSQMVHGSLFLFFSVIFYNQVYNHKNPYDKGYVKAQEELVDDISITEDVQVSQYKQILQDWFEQDKPYLRKEFRLMDLSEKIPLNRTYLSKLINDEFNSNFNNFIADYRLRESCNSLINDPKLSIKTISENCGFSSPSVFTRTFINKYGMTPSSYRQAKKIIG